MIGGHSSVLIILVVLILNSVTVINISVSRSQSFSPVKNALVSTTAAGEVIIFVMPHPARNLSSLKDLNLFRAPIYRVDLAKFLSDIDPKKQAETYLSRYEDLAKEDPILLFHDAPTKNLSATSKSEHSALRSSTTMTPENPEMYPLSSVNTVAISANLNGPTLLFSGGQSGLGRIHHLASLDH